MLTYANVNLMVAPADLLAWVAANIPVSEQLQFEFRTWPGKRLTQLTWDGTVLPRAVQPGTLWWPRGASRFAVGWFLCSTNQLKKIRAACYSEGAASVPVPQTLRISQDNRDGQTVSSISTSMYLLPVRPLQAIPGYNGLHLLTLVDQRYFWHFANTGAITVNENSTTWQNLYTTLQAQLGITIAVDPINAAYITPSVELTSYYESAAILLDAVAYNVGQRIVCRLDGSVHALNVTTSQASVRTQLASFAQQRRNILAGGQYAFSPSPPPTDLASILPESVTVVYPLTTNGVPQPQTPYVKTVTLASLALPEFAGIKGHNTTKTFHDTDQAMTPDGINPTNLTELTALTKQIATDFYRYCAAKLDQKYVGILAWQPEGLTDSITWTYQSKPEVSTYLKRGPLVDMTEELLHGGGNFNVVNGPVKYEGSATYDAPTYYISITINKNTTNNYVANYNPTYIGGIFVSPPSPPTPYSGGNNNVPIPAAWEIPVLPTGPGANWTGMAGGFNGRIVTVINFSLTYAFTFVHNSGMSSVGNQFWFQSLTNLTIACNYGCATFKKVGGLSIKDSWVVDGTPAPQNLNGRYPQPVNAATAGGSTWRTTPGSIWYASNTIAYKSANPGVYETATINCGDQVMTLSVPVTLNDTFGTERAGLVIRWQDDNNWYGFWRNGANNRLELVEMLSGTLHVLASTADPAIGSALTLTLTFNSLNSLSGTAPGAAVLTQLGATDFSTSTTGGLVSFGIAATFGQSFIATMNTNNFWILEGDPWTMWQPYTPIPQPSGTQNDYLIPQAVSLERFAPTNNLTFTGFNGAQEPGAFYRFGNQGTAPIIVPNLGGSAGGNQVVTPTGSPMGVGPGGAALMIWDDQLGNWFPLKPPDYAEVSVAATFPNMPTINGNQSYRQIKITSGSKIDGLAGGWPGRQIEIWNVGGGILQIVNFSSSTSAAANRIYTGIAQDIFLNNNQSTLLEYDWDGQVWRVIGYWPLNNTLCVLTNVVCVNGVLMGTFARITGDFTVSAC
jgi:hypothetical protein